MDMTVIKIGTARPEQLDRISEIERQCFSLPWTPRQLEHQMLADNCVFYVAETENGDILGYVGMMFVLDEGYISNIATAPEHRRKGVADALLCALERFAREKELSFITLEVRESNSAAIALYSKHGFKSVGVRKNYYERPRENALLMTRFFPSAQDSKAKEGNTYANNVN